MQIIVFILIMAKKYFLFFGISHGISHKKIAHIEILKNCGF